MDKVSVSNRVIKAVADTFYMDISEVGPESHLANDLGADSLDHVEIFMNVEKEFQINIPDEVCENLLTVNAITDYVYEQMKDK